MFEESLIWLNSAKTACEAAGVDTAILSWTVAVVVALGVAFKTLKVGFYSVRGAYRFFAPRDEIAERIVASLNDTDTVWKPAHKELSNGDLHVYVKLDTYDNVKEIESVHVGTQVGLWSILSLRSQRRVRDAAIAAITRSRLASVAAKRRETLKALRSV